MGAYLRLIRKFGRKGGSGIVAVAVVAVALLVTSFPAMADDPFTSRPHEWNARQNFWKAINRKAGSVDTVESGATIQLNAGSVLKLNTTPVESIAYLGGTTGTIAWSAAASTNTAADAGNSGWHLTLAHLKQYSKFLVDPSGGTAGASKYTKECPSSIGGIAGATIYLPNIDTSLHGRAWKFTNITGTTPFVIYNRNARMLVNGYTGTTQSPVSATVNAPEDIGDTVSIYAIGTPSAVSGYVVTSIKYYD